MMDPTKHLLWDFDGTLAHRPGQWTDTVLTVLRHAGLDRGIDRESVRPFVNAGFPWHEPDRVRQPGQSADEWWAALSPILARAFKELARLDDQRAAELASMVRGIYLDATAWVVFDDVVPTLKRLGDLGWRHVMLSNHVPELPQLVERLGLAGYFEAIHTSAVTGVEKPNSLAFRRVAAAMPSGSRLWMIGDNPEVDVRGAEAVGIPAILVRCGSPSVKRRCSSLPEVVTLVEALELAWSRNVSCGPRPLRPIIETQKIGSLARACENE